MAYHYIIYLKSQVCEKGVYQLGCLFRGFSWVGVDVVVVHDDVFVVATSMCACLFVCLFGSGFVVAVVVVVVVVGVFFVCFFVVVFLFVCFVVVVVLFGVFFFLGGGV